MRAVTGRNNPTNESLSHCASDYWTPGLHWDDNWLTLGRQWDERDRRKVLL